MCVILSSSLALLHTKRDPLGHDLPLQGKESKRTSAALTIGMKTCNFCHWAPLQFLPTLTPADRAAWVDVAVSPSRTAAGAPTLGLEPLHHPLQCLGACTLGPSTQRDLIGQDFPCGVEGETENASRTCCCSFGAKDVCSLYQCWPQLTEVPVNEYRI